LVVLYSVSGLAAATLPFDSTSPVIYDNDGAVESGYTDVYIMALASAGAIDLRGIISTGTNGEQPPFIPRPEDNMVLERRELVAKARRSGMRNLPDPSPGPGVSMSSRRPASGRIEDTPPFGAQGSWLIVTEARKATPSRPLVVVMGGQGSAVADAYLLDNSIADKVVVAWLVGGRRTSNGILHGFEYNAYVDSWATYIVFERLRVVAFPVDEADSVPSTPKSRFGELPDTEIRQYMLESRWPRSSQTYSEPANDWDVMGAIALTDPTFRS
jgi:inosine-uridine nucleoside N-ribohydrolase